MLDLTQLRSFAEVAERGTVAAAAEALGYTPPAVSQHLSKLEVDLGTSLFDRSAGRLVLSEAGTRLLPLAFELLHLVGRAEEVVRLPAGPDRLVLAGIASAIGALVAPRLDALADVAAVELLEAEDTAALRGLRLGHVDIALIQEYPGDAAGRDARFTHTVVASDALRLVLPPSYPARTKLRDLGVLPWLVNGSGTRCEAASRQLLREAGISPRVVADVSDNAVLLQLVAAGHGATIVPGLLLGETAAEVTVAREDLGVTRDLVAVTGAPAREAVRAVVDALSAGRTPRRRQPARDRRR